MRLKYILISVFLLLNISYALENKFIDPRNNDGKIIDIGYEEAQGEAYLSKGWQKVLSELKQVPNIREFKSRNLTREELCITDFSGENVCPYNWQECRANYEYHDGFSKETTKTRYQMKIKKEVSSASGSKMEATYSLRKNGGSISGATWEAKVLRGELSPNTPGIDLYNEGFKTKEGKFAMKAFNFGSGCGGLTIKPLPDRLRVLKDGGSRVRLQPFRGNCNQTITSWNGQWATVYMEWDEIPEKISWNLDDYGYISTPDSVLGFVKKVCPDNYIEMAENPNQCMHTYKYYTYTCPEGDIGIEEEDYKYTSWTRPLISSGGDCGGDLVSGSSCNSPIPPEDNCKRSKYICPIDNSISCVQTSGESEKRFKRLEDQGISKRHDKVLTDSKIETRVIDEIEKKIETKIEWSDKITALNTEYSEPEGENGDKLFCLKDTVWDKDLKKCTSLAKIEYVETEVPDYTTWEGGSGGIWSIKDEGTTLYQSKNGAPTKMMTPTVYGYGTFEGVINHSSLENDDDYMGFVLGYENEEDYYLLSWGTGWDNSVRGLYLIEVTSGSKDFWNYTGSGMNILGSSNISWSNDTNHNIKVKLSADNMTVTVDGIERINVNGSFHAGKFGYYNYSLARVSYKGFKGSDLQTISCPDETMTIEKVGELYKCYGEPSVDGSLSETGTTKAECTNGGDWDNNCIKCPTVSWTPPENCIDCGALKIFEINDKKTGSANACIYEYETRECPLKYSDDHGTDIAGNTCNESNQNNYGSNCDDCSRTITTMMCPSEAEFPEETYPEIEDADNWFSNEEDSSICQRLRIEYSCESEDYKLIDGLCQKKYTYYEYQCKNNEWIGPNVSGEDCLGTCKGFDCLCNNELPPEDNCYQDIPLISGKEPIVSRPAKQYETTDIYGSSFNGSEYGLSKGYSCVDESGENCGYDVYKIEGEGEKLCFHDKLFYKECIDVKGCNFEGSIEIDKKESFSLLKINQETNKIEGYVKDRKIDGEIKSSCVINGQVGKINKLGGFNSVVMKDSKMSFWNSYTKPEDITPKSCQKGKYDKTTDKCLPEEDKTYNAHIKYEIKSEQPEQKYQEYSYGTKVIFEEDTEGKAKVLLSANYIGHCPEGIMDGYLCIDSSYAVRNFSYDSEDSTSKRYRCERAGFEPESQPFFHSTTIRCVKGVIPKPEISESDWFIKDLLIPLNESTVKKEGLSINIKENKLIIVPDSTKNSLYTHTYILERKPEFSCDSGDVKINEYTCQKGNLLEGEDYLVNIELLNGLSKDRVNKLDHKYRDEIYYDMTKDENKLNSSGGSLDFRIIKGLVEINGMINIENKYKIIGNKSNLEYYEYLSDGKSKYVGSHKLEWDGTEIQTIGGIIRKRGVFEFSASDIDFNLYMNEIRVKVEHSEGSSFNGIIKLETESNQYCPVGKTPSFGGCIKENIELGFFEFVPSCKEVQEKYPEFFYEGFRERNLLYDFNTIVKFEDKTYARSSYKMTETECQEKAEDADWKIATISRNNVCDKGWYENGDVCQKESNPEEWVDIIEEIYSGKMKPEDLFITNVPGLSLEFVKGDDLITGEKGLFIYTSPTNLGAYGHHTEGFHFKPSFEYDTVDLSYKMQGTDEGYRCSHGHWIPLNGPGYEGGGSYYKSACLDGYNCIQGSNVTGQDAPISASYRNDEINSKNTLLTWSGSNYNNGITAGDCARSEHIPDDRAGTFFTKFKIKGYSKVETKPKNLDKIEEQKRFFEEYIPEGTYLDIFGSDGEPGEEPEARFEYSCNGLYTKNSDMKSGVYPIRFSKEETVPTYCDISSNQGWMLAGKIDGSKTTFLYDNPIWKNDTLLNENDTSLSKVEMKNKIWTRKKFTKMKLVFNTNGEERTLVIPISGESLKRVFETSSFASANVSRSDWKNVIPNSSLQRNCNQNGINISVATGKVRIGIISNQESDCNTPDSFIGIGSNRRLAPGGHDVTAGNWAGNWASDNGAKNHKSFVYIYVSDTEDKFEREPGTNEAYCVIEHEGDRTFSSMPMCVQLTGVEEDRKFHCSQVSCNENETCQLARCEEGKEGLPDFMGVKQKPGFDFTDICTDQECDANKKYTPMCGRDTGCEEGNGAIIKKDGNCYEQYCEEGDLVYDNPRNKCKIYSCPEGTIEQEDGRCLVP